jgi:hypothetical protein
MWQKCPDNFALAVMVFAQNFKGVVMTGFENANQWFGQRSRCLH